ncbi:MAG TPA: EAL domain-containing protein [Xanthobacteraceae bacterium]|nr:EAL domain-containing protein [Xanthobacteraceae bacterium]
MIRAVARKLTRCPNCALAAFGVVFAAAIVIAFAADLKSRYDHSIDHAKQVALNSARVMAEDAARTFEGVDHALRVAEVLRREAEAEPRGGVAAHLAASRRAHEALQQIQRASALIVSIGWSNAAGDIVASSNEPQGRTPNVADRTYFTIHRDRADVGLFIAPLFRSHRGGQWLTAVSRRVSGPDGRFAGTIKATLDPEYFSRIYRSLDFGASGATMLVHASGVLVAREPFIESAVGHSFADAPVLKYLAHAPAGAYVSSGFHHPQARIVGYMAVPKLPLVVLVSVDRSEVLAAWYSHLATFGPLVAIVVIVTLLGTVLLMRQAKKLAENASMLQLTLDYTAHGLAMVDGEKRLTVCNKRYADIYGIPPEFTQPGTPLRAILEARIGTDNAPLDEHDFVERRLEEVARTVPFQTTNRLRDGRVIAVTHRPVPGRGSVTIHQDVTAEKHTEASLITKSEELARANMRFDAALNNMSQGLCMFDSSLRVVVANHRFAEIYGLRPEQVTPGTTLRQILEARIANGGLTADEFLKKGFDEPSELETLADGRVVSILRHWLPDGGVLTTHEDITDRRQSEAKIAFMAHHDLLTGLANRTYFMEKIQEAGARLRRRGEPFTVFMLDLDRFKDVNDSLGHPAGDALLKELARRLKSALRETDVLARLGGDEFAILQSGEAAQRDEAIALAVRIIDIVAAPFDLDGRTVRVGTSIGIALAPQDGIEPDELLKKADLALYRTKSEGRNGFNFFHSDMTAEVDARHQLENEMREGLSRNEFVLHYQPVFDAETREPRGAEALVRWQHPRQGLIAPDRFIPLAEDTGLIVQLGEWILQKACADAVSWPNHIKVAINLSSVQFRKGDLFDIILCALVDSGLPPERLELEITESVLLENEANYRLVLQQLRNIGVSIVLDDFGTGYSSLGYLTAFPVDKIKIDKAFTQGLIERAECAAVIASVLTLARGLDIATTAEGVETEEQYDMLRAAGVNQVQGYLFASPRPSSELTFGRAELNSRATAA